jgi:hypothetical protein
MPEEPQENDDNAPKDAASGLPDGVEEDARDVPDRDAMPRSLS